MHKEHENIVLSKEAGLHFLDALENPLEPNERLIEALCRHDFWTSLKEADWKRNFLLKILPDGLVS